VGSNRQLIDVGGFSLSTEWAGDGRPAIILEAGGSSPSDTWDPVWPGLVALSRTFRYDRAGVGRSERSPHPRTSRQMVGELHLLLDHAGVAPPYVLVGHSFGAQIVRIFAGTYPAEIAGLVLVDGAQEDLGIRMKPFLTEDGWQAYCASWDEYPSAEDVSFVRLPAIEDGLRTTGRQLPDVPLVVLHGANRAAWEAAVQLPWWPMADFFRVAEEIRTEEALLTPRGRLVLAERSGHMVHHDEPELVVDAVRSVIETAHGR
jgi:pimeloyl-ACP methyl ester carboxylesterase